ncbi:SdiA-regulated domain-containing protein [Methylobacillus caricis]|uniref:SdiA-regulated domain-containing protein n=1 Tax=Methylobacillus caricis TaxID=1971611 RepID=UPI001D0015A5|nr:SdiA-regulated domain-containing protein [Methylobacillus caricis]MCB5188808.1 SdiA-regulated domain-containing protein [Methylobacillus caricis]
MLAITGLAVLLIAAYLFRLEALAWHMWSSSRHSPASTMNLKHYTVEHEAIAIPGVGADLSDLSYNRETNTLFTVSNKQPLIVELGLDGQVLRKVHVKGIADMEGIAHVGGNRFILLNEHEHSLVLTNLEPGIEEIDVTHDPKLTLAMYAVDNKGFEGVMWDADNQRVLLAKERAPKRVIAVHGFVDALPGQPIKLRIEKLAQTSSHGLRDLSAISYDHTSGNILLLSDDSRMVAEYDDQGKMLGTLALWHGFHGLDRNIPQAEGLAIGPDKRIYVISEPNLFYVFKPVVTSSAHI